MEKEFLLEQERERKKEEEVFEIETFVYSTRNLDFLKSEEHSTYHILMFKSMPSQVYRIDLLLRREIL